MKGLHFLVMKTIASNRKAHHEYNILETLEAGIVLTGHEAKSAKDGRMSLSGGRVFIKDEEAFIAGVEIASFQPKNAPSDYDSARAKKLLLSEREISYLLGKITHSSLTVIPIRAYIKKDLVKIGIALVERKKKRDKREDLKKRDIQRDVERQFRKRID